VKKSSVVLRFLVKISSFESPGEVIGEITWGCDIIPGEVVVETIWGNM